MLFVGRAGICGVKSSVVGGCGSPLAGCWGDIPDTAKTSCGRVAGDGVRRRESAGLSLTFVCNVPYDIAGTGSPTGAGGSGGDALDWKRTLALVIRSSISVSWRHRRKLEENGDWNGVDVCTFHDCTLSRSPLFGMSSSPKMTDPNTIARFFASILFFSLRDATLARCSTIAFRVA